MSVPPSSAWAHSKSTGLYSRASYNNINRHVFYREIPSMNSDKAQDSQPTIIPYFVYRDGAAALKWLTDAFGFEQIAAFTGPDGNILHAEMHFGSGAIMLGTATDEQRATTLGPPGR